jgi:hypothetical protein
MTDSQHHKNLTDGQGVKEPFASISVLFLKIENKKTKKFPGPLI